jgi:hypothetical protein
MYVITREERCLEMMMVHSVRSDVFVETKRCSDYGWSQTRRDSVGLSLSLQ